MEELDMSGVDPLRRAEVRRRVAAIKAFIAIGETHATDRKVYADQLSLSVNQFMALVRAWNETPLPSSIAGSGAHRGRQRATGPRHLAAAVSEILAEALANLPPRVSLGEAYQAVAAACAGAAVSPPTKTTVHKMLMATRRLNRSPEDEGVVVLGRCWIRLPTLSEQQIVMPTLAMALRAEDGVIIAGTLSEGRLQSGALAGLASQMNGVMRLHVDETIADATNAGMAASFEPAPSIRRRIARVLGDRIGSMRLVYKAGAHERAERLLRARKDVPLTPAEVASIVRAEIDANNIARGALRAVWID